MELNSPFNQSSAGRVWDTIPIHNNTALPMDQRVAKLVGSYQSLLGDHTINVYQDGQRNLSAIITLLDATGNPCSSSAPLPLKGVSLKTWKGEDPSSFLKNSHMIPEKDVDGCLNGVAVHVSGDGGMRAKIPMQPGLELGGIVDPAIIDKMNAYSSQQETLQALEEQVQDVEQRITVLNAKIDARKGNGENDLLITNYRLQITKLNESLTAITTEMTKAVTTMPTFANFVAKPVSPIDKSASRIEVLATGFDSLTFHSQYVTKSELSSYIQDSVKQNTTAFSGSVGAGWGPWSAKVSHSLSKGSLDRLGQLEKNDNTVGVFVVNAFVTTRNVRCLTNVKYNKSVLRAIDKAMGQKDNSLDNQYGITTLPDDKETKAIYILSEAVLGGSFTGLLTFLDKSKTKQNKELHSTEKQTETGGGISGGISLFKVKGKASVAKQKADQSEKDDLDNLANIDVSVEIIAQGAIPEVVTEKMKQEMLKHIDTQAADFKPSHSKGKDEDAGDRQGEIQKNQAEMANTKRSLETVTKEHSVPTVATVMQAYNHFSEKMKSDHDSGIPIGFNYDILTRARIQELLEDTAK